MLKYDPTHCFQSNIIWTAVRFVSSFLIGTVCICGDYIMIKIPSESHMELALTDNITHGFVGLFVALVIVSYFHNQLTTFEIALATALTYMLSALVDIDHFIEARTTQLKEATSLSHRPFLHNTTLIIILFICILVFKRGKQNFVRKLALLIPLTGVFVHHTRDAVRRGYWLYPFGSTPILPYPVYILISIIIPNLYYLVKSHDNYYNHLGNNHSFLA